MAGRRIVEILDPALREETIEALPRPFACVATELGTGHEVWLQKGKLVDAMRASYALPGIFSPVLVDGRWLLDGALVNPIPVSVCRALGARLVIAVNLNTDAFGEGVVELDEGLDTAAEQALLAGANGNGANGGSFLRQLFSRPGDEPSLLTVMASALNIMQDRLSRSRLAGEPPDVMIAPRLAHIGLLQFDRAAEAIAAGDYGRRVDISRRDEVGRLGETFNVMAARVAESRRALEQRTEALRESNEELARQTMVAQTANQAKSDFLAVMSHEIRTPINAILGYTQLMDLGIPDPVTEGQRAQLERVRASGHHLLGLVNELLDLARVESGQLTVLRERAVAADAADAALALLRPQAAAKGVSVAERCGGARDALYLGDEQRVRQVVVNLLSNAVKFTTPGGRVSVRCDTTRRPPTEVAGSGAGAWTALSVEDTGIGIAPEHHELVFREFAQVDASASRQHHGTGLGLAIARKFIELHDGRIWLESAIGQGTRFYCTIPVRTAAGAARDGP
jgi:signal transduction histidine kinase